MTKPRTKNQLTATESRKYLHALGKFIHVYAKAEAIWHKSLRGGSGVAPEMVRAMTGGMRGGEVINTIRKVLEIRPMSPEKRAQFDEAVEHFNAISEFRDRLIHRGADPKEDDLTQLISTNEEYYRTIGDFEYIAFTSDDIARATHDLAKVIVLVILSSVRDEHMSLIPPIALRLARVPWWYTRLKPETPNRQPKPKKTPKRGHLPHA